VEINKEAAVHIDGLVVEVGYSKLFAKCKSDGHCLHHMLPPSNSSSHMMVLRPLVMTMMSLESITRQQRLKRSSMMRCLYGQKTVG